MLFEAAVLAAINLNHAAVVNLRAKYSIDLQHLQELGGDLEATTLASLRAIGAYVAKVEWPHRQKGFNTRVFHVEWQLELLF